MATKAELAGSASSRALATRPAREGNWDDEFVAHTADPNLDEETDAEAYVPEGFKDADAFLAYAREEFEADSSYDRLNREAALDDLKFVAGEQWDPAVKADRESKGRPCLTVNVLPQFIGQVIGDRRINKTTIKVRPRKDATIEQAEVRSGIIKSIEAYSRAERVYDAACENQVTCGIGNFRVDLDYADNDVFDQDIYIRDIPNPLAVIWDRMSVDPTGRDAQQCFVQDIMPRKAYERRWPQHPCPGEMGDGLGMTLMGQGWFDKDVVRITEFWRMVSKQRIVALMMDGKVEDITEMPREQYIDRLWIDQRTNKPRIRRTTRTYAQMHLITGFAILEGPYEIPLTRLPIIRVEGRVVRVGDDRVRYGLVRWAKDPQRLKNYWRSVSAETLALAPKSVWMAPDDAVEGREDDFREAHASGDPLLIYNKNASAKPERVDPPRINNAALQESQLNQQDIKDTTGLQDASLGARSNEISGRAIQARQREGDVATVIYHDNLNNAIQEGGDIVNQLIPLAYDTTRELRVIGADDKHKLLKVNDPNDPQSPDITSGKYDISLETGPSYTTQRLEAADAMMQAIQVAPQLMGVAGDLIVRAQDWPGSVEISERLKKTIPPAVLGEDEQPATDGPTPEEVAQQAQMAEMAAQAEHAQQLRQMEMAERSAKVAEQEARAVIAAAQAEAAPAQVDIAAAQAREAVARAVQAEEEARMAPELANHKMRLAERAASAKEASQPARGAGPRPGGGRGNQASQQKGNTK